MSDMGRQLEHMKAPALTRLVTFKTLTKDGTEKKQKQLYSPFFGEHFTPNKCNVKSTSLTALKIKQRTILLSGSGKARCLNNKGKGSDKYSIR